MGQAQGVAKLVDGFFQETLVQKVTVRRQSIELLSKAVSRNQSAATFELRLTENEGEDRDIQVQRRHAKDSPARGGQVLLHAGQEVG